jgi:tripartite-type tricarboxylate transporter receptor subunit TctC
LADPALSNKIAAPGHLVSGGTPEQFAALIASDSRRCAALVKAKGIKME